MAAGGWIGKYAFQDGGLAADADGRAAVADNFLTNEMVNSGELTASKFAAGVLGTGVYGVGVYGTARYG